MEQRMFSLCFSESRVYSLSTMAKLSWDQTKSFELTPGWVDLGTCVTEHQVGKVNCISPQAGRPMLVETRLVVLTPDYLTTNQSEECAPADVALLVKHFKTGHYPLQDRTHSLDRSSPLWPPLPGNAVKLFLSTSPKTLCLCVSVQHQWTEAVSATLYHFETALDLGLGALCCSASPRQIPGHMSSRNRILRNYEGLKITEYMCTLGKLHILLQATKIPEIQLPLLKSQEQNRKLHLPPAFNTTKGLGRPRKLQ